MTGVLCNDVADVRAALRRSVLEGVVEALAHRTHASWPLDRVETARPACGAVLAASAAWTADVEEALRGGAGVSDGFRERLAVGAPTFREDEDDGDDAFAAAAREADAAAKSGSAGDAAAKSGSAGDAAAKPDTSEPAGAWDALEKGVVAALEAHAAVPLPESIR